MGAPEASPAPALRKILHIDMDAFYASVEQRDRPELRGKPLIVGGDPAARGVVASASYEARAFGVRSAISSARAQRLCPDAIFVRPDFDRYRAASAAIFALFREVTPLVESLSLDEAYLDVTHNTLAEPLAGKIALHLKRRIRSELGLTASAGAATTKFVAKIASDLQKPDGLVLVPPEQTLTFLAPLPVERLWGVGPATARALHSLGLSTILDVRERSADDLEAALGRHGRALHALAHGIDDRPVEPHREPKSRASETTFVHDVLDRSRLEAVAEEQAREVADSLLAMDRSARTITLKLRYDDFTTVTRSLTLPQATRDAACIARTAVALLRERTEAGSRPVRLIGVSTSGLAEGPGPEQLSLDF